MKAYLIYAFALLLFVVLIPPNSVYSATGRQSVHFETEAKACFITFDSLLDAGKSDQGKNTLGIAWKALSRGGNPDPVMNFRYYTRLARYFSFIDDCDKAFRAFQIAEDLYDVINKDIPIELARDYAEHGSLCMRLQQYHDAIIYFRKAISIMNGVTKKQDVETVYFKACLANAYWNDCQPGQADRLLELCMKFTDNIPDKLDKHLLDLYLTLSDYLINNDFKYDLAQKGYLDYATLILRDFYSSDHYKYVILYYLKGVYKIAKNQYEDGVQCANQSIQLASPFPLLKSYRAKNYRTIVNYYFSSFYNYKKVIEYCTEKLSAIKETPENESYYYYITGLSYLNLNDSVKARKYFIKAIQLSSKNNYAAEIGIRTLAYFKLSSAYSIMLHPDITLFFLTKALEIAKLTSSKGNTITSINYNLGMFYYYHGEYYKSLKYAQQALIAGCYNFNDTTITQNPFISDIRPSYVFIEALALKANSLYKIYRKNINYLKSALQSVELSSQLIENWVLHTDDENGGLVAIEERKRCMNNAVCYASVLYMRTGERIYAEKALNLSEKSKMQVLLINTTKKYMYSRTGIPDSLVRRVEKLNNGILNLENGIVLKSETGQSQSEVIQRTRLIRLIDQRDILYQKITKEYPEAGITYNDIKVKGIPEIQQMIAKDQVIVEYQQLEGQVIAMVILKDTFSISYQLIYPQFLKNLELLRKTISTSPYNQDQDSSFASFVSSSSYLYNILIRPIYKEIKGKRLIIIPHNELSRIPFEILIPDFPVKSGFTDYRRLPYLIKEFPIIYAYSANFLLDNKGNNKYGKGTAVFLPDYTSYKVQKKDQVFQNLKGAKEEANLVRKITGGRMFAGDAADETTFKRKAFKYRILHIASHTIIDESRPDLSCFVMSAPKDTINDGLLYAYEIKQMQLKAQLVVLSGCNTGYGQLKLSEGLVSLARSLFYTGIRTVAFTLWLVADDAGAQLTSLFYDGLKHHKTLDISLRDAKLGFLEQADPVKSHPYYWANYIVVGKAANVPLRIFPKWPGITVSFLLVAGFIFFIYRRFRSPAFGKSFLPWKHNNHPDR